MAFSRKILQLFNGICNIMVSPNVRNLIFATIVSLFFQATHSILNSHALISTTHVRKNCSWSKSRWSEQKVWFSQTLISNPRCYATGKGFLCLCTMQYKWPLFPIQLGFFLRFSLHLQTDICVLNSGYANQTWRFKTLFRISAMLIIGY